MRWHRFVDIYPLNVHLAFGYEAIVCQRQARLTDPIYVCIIIVTTAKPASDSRTALSCFRLRHWSYWIGCTHRSCGCCCCWCCCSSRHNPWTHYQSLALCKTYKTHADVSQQWPQAASWLIGFWFVRAAVMVVMRWTTYSPSLTAIESTSAWWLANHTKC